MKIIYAWTVDYKRNANRIYADVWGDDEMWIEEGGDPSDCTLVIWPLYPWRFYA